MKTITFRLPLDFARQPGKFAYQFLMRTLRILVLLPALISSGCFHMHDTSSSATTEQIRVHLLTQLHCHTMDLHATGKNAFSGNGRNDTGDFSLTATRDGNTIAFKGVYAAPGQGTFSGSASWDRSFNAGFGFHRSRISTSDSLGAP
jgi:hypothetical protein